MPHASLNGIDVYYERSGEGPTLLYFNGTGATLESSRLSIDPYTKHFDVVVHDQRGLGATEAPPGPYTMADYATDGRALLDHLGLDRVRVVGTSFGGMVAQEFAITFPERVERLALLCTSAGGKGGSSYPLGELAALPPAERRAKGMSVVDSRWTEEWLAEHELDRMIADVISTAVSAEPGSDRERGEKGQVAARADHDAWDRLPLITAPTLVAAGRYDGVAPLANSEAIASRIPGAELRAYEGGHVFFFQDPTAIPEIIEFLNG
ncbi:MAG TPA: alpha/beta fold hydrolase [Acidimicrobiales bacterium]